MGVPVLYAGSKYYPGIPPDKQYPAFSAAEVGNVNASTVAVTFSINISASDYAAGVTIKVNGSAATISSATRQANHAIVYYVLSAAVVFGDTVTWEYSGGSIVNETTGAVMQTTSAQSVTNNVADTIGNGLRADAVAYWKMDESSGTRVDATGHGHNLLTVGSIDGVAGKIGNSAQLTRTAVNGLKLINDGSFQSFGGSIFFCAWVKVDTLASGDHTIFFRLCQVSSPVIDYYLAYSPSMQKFYLDVFDTDNNENAYAESGIISIGSWHFVLAYIDGDLQKVGLQTDSILTTGDFYAPLTPPGSPYSPSSLSVGSEISFNAQNVTEFQVDGEVDEVGFWRRVPSTDEINYLYNGGAGRALFPAP